jgi:hypothetical protein
MARKRTASIERERAAIDDGPRKPIGAGVRPELLAPRMLGVDILDPDPRNARRHNARNLKAIRASLELHGQHRALVVQKRGERYVVRIGNGTLQAAKELGWPAVACVVIEEDDARAMARALADNRAGELATWDDAELSAQLRELEEGLLGPATGFTEAEIQKLLDGAGTAPAEPAEAPRVAPEPDRPKYTRLVNLYFTTEGLEEWERLLGVARSRLGEDDASQAALRALREYVRGPA